MPRIQFLVSIPGPSRWWKAIFKITTCFIIFIHKANCLCSSRRILLGVEFPLEQARWPALLFVPYPVLFLKILDAGHVGLFPSVFPIDVVDQGIDDSRICLSSFLGAGNLPHLNSVHSKMARE